MRVRLTETLVGLFMLAGILALLVLALKVSGLNLAMSNKGYSITASFDNVGGLKPRAPVTVSGVRIGEVATIQLNPTDFKAVVTMHIDSTMNNLSTDSSASILTQGLLGANYISLIPGFAETNLVNGSQIENTHSALILESLIGQLIFSLKNSDKSKE